VKTYLFAIILALVSPIAAAKGVPFAVKSLQQAEEIARQDNGKHVLIFFTHES
jgi:hypothetical protein